MQELRLKITQPALSASGVLAGAEFFPQTTQKTQNLACLALLIYEVISPLRSLVAG